MRLARKMTDCPRRLYLENLLQLPGLSGEVILPPPCSYWQWLQWPSLGRDAFLPMVPVPLFTMSLEVFL